MRHRVAWLLTSLRLAYAALGAGTCVAGLLVLVEGNPPLASLVLAAGVLAIAAAAWVRTEHHGRGALASIGVVVGPLPAIGVALLLGNYLAAFGAPTLAAVAVGAILLCVAMTALMWRASSRPWEIPQTAAR